MEEVNGILKEDLISSFDLTNVGPDENPVFQFVYASQLYGTLFAVYGRFDSVISENRCTLKRLALRLINYKGVLNIGFTNHEPLFVESSEGGDVYFGVKGTSKKRETKVNFETPIVLEHGTRFRLTFHRILYPMVGNPPEYTIDTKYGEPGKLDVDADEVFDSEFFDRSGVDRFSNPLRPGMANFDGGTIEKLREGSMLGSPRCSQGIASLYF
jgi:hypothetical protein